jgi:hypothetical protein
VETTEVTGWETAVLDGGPADGLRMKVSDRPRVIQVTYPCPVEADEDGRRGDGGEQMVEEVRHTVVEVGPVRDGLRDELHADPSAEEDLGGLLGHHVRQYLTALLGLRQQRARHLGPGGPGAAEHIAALQVGREPDPREQHRLPGQPLGQRHARVHPFLQLQFPGDVVLGGHLLLQHTAGERSLGVEVEVQGALGHAGPVEDLGDGGGRVATLGEHRGGGFQNSTSGPDSSLLLSHGPSSS